MITVKTIDDIYEKMLTVPLSSIIPMIYSIAIECKDYSGLCTLVCVYKGVNDNIDANLIQKKELINLLKLEGLSDEVLTKAYTKGLADYLQIMSCGENIHIGSSVKTIEDRFQSFDKMIEIATPPDNLAPVDLYYRSQVAAKDKLYVLEQRKKMEIAYSNILSYVTTKLACYRSIISKKERTIMIEKRIKNTKNVFIIHGHNEAKRRELEKLLKEQFGLNPIVLLDKANEGLTIISKFEKYASTCSYAFALFTPDDIIETADGNRYFQARPNVIFELGWFYASIGRNRVCILEQESDKSEIFSDLQGILRIQFKRDISEKFLEIKRELDSIGLI